MAEKVNGIIANEAVRNIRGYSEDEIAQKAAFKRERAIADYNNRYDDGRVDERVSIVNKLFEKGFTAHDIADSLDMPLAEVQNIIDGYVIDI